LPDEGGSIAPCLPARNGQKCHDRTIDRPASAPPWHHITPQKIRKVHERPLDTLTPSSPSDDGLHFVVREFSWRQFLT
jgi:hypothetical protein